MRKRREILLNSRAVRIRQACAGTALAGVTICAALISHFLLFQGGVMAHIVATSTPTSAPTSASTLTPTPAVSPFLYFVLKQNNGFVLARAHADANKQPTGTPQTLALFDNAFGQSPADNVISLQLSPDDRYLAIDGSHSDSELLWIFDTQNQKLIREPANVSGTFLHWLPGTSGLFLYRPILPLGLDTTNWKPGLWLGDAITDTFKNIEIPTPSTFLVDAIGSPDDSQILFSTSGGLGLGSDIWTVDLSGLHLDHLLRLADSAQSVAGMFTWSPDGQSIAYERLNDSPTPFLAAGLWIMDRKGGHQRFLAQADGGHGFLLRWSPDSQKIAFVSRTNLRASLADQSIQALQSAVDVVNVASGRVWSVASPLETGVQINANPTWNANSTQITFAAFNPLNPDIGGNVRYWSVQANQTSLHPSAVKVSPTIAHVIALG